MAVSAGKRAKRRGASFELEIARVLSEALGRDVRRNIGQARDGGDDITVGRVRVECKRRARISAYEWIEQVERACSPGEWGAVVFRADHRAAYAIVPLAQLVTLLRLEGERDAP